MKNVIESAALAALLLCGCVRSIDGGAALDAFIAEKGLGRK